MPSFAEVPLPATIGPFRVVRLLGSGAMGAVYLAERAEQFQQRVAIKLLHPQVSLLSGDEALRHEEQVLTSLDHEAIVRLLDTGVHADGRAYLVMECVDGSHLDVACRAQRMTRARRLLLLVEIARALEYAHRYLVIHADLKPENILLSPEGKPKILDFGVAVLMDQTGRAADRQERYSLSFASPEQRAGRRLTPRTDIYSLGLIARALLEDAAGKPERLGKDLQAILSRATREEPEHRYATMQDFGDDLQAAAEHRPVAARNGNGLYRFGRWIRYRRTAATVAFALALILMVSVAGVVVRTVAAARQRRVTQARLFDLVRVTGTLEGELYESSHALAGGKEASSSLLQAATTSLDRLSEESGGDSALKLEIAEQYRKLAQLQRVDGGGAGSVEHDVRQGLALLESVGPRDRNYQSARRQIAAINAR